LPSFTSSGGQQFTGSAVTYEAVILAAGLGSRLGRPHPKPLTPLASGQSIMRQQVENLRSRLGQGLRISAVVGFKLHMIVEANPDIGFVYNEAYDVTNTSASLRKALELTGDAGILWLNGDVVFDAALIDDVRGMLESGKSFVCVNTESVADEEIKYTLDKDGYIADLSKTVTGGLGEAVGINYVGPRDKATVLAGLARCADQDYFERGLEIAIAESDLRLRPIDISRHVCIEVDMQEDLERANSLIQHGA